MTDTQKIDLREWSGEQISALAQALKEALGKA